MLRNTLLFTPILLLISACGSGKNDKNSQKKDKASGPVTLDVSIAKSFEIANHIESNGTILAFEYVELKPEMPGRITYLNINEGMFVQEGVLLAKLNDEDLQAQLKKYKSQLTLAQSNEKRLSVLLKAEGLNQAEYDQALQQVSNIEADIAYTQAMINKTELRAPFSGVIGLRNVSKGAYVTQQNVLATIQQTNAMKVDFVLPETYAMSIKTGMKVEVISEGACKLKATVTGIEPQINTATRNLKVRAVVDANSCSLRPGAFVKVIFNEGEAKNRIMVPSNVIIPETRFKKIALIKNGIVEIVNVETGIRNGSDVEIISGVNEGDTFAINGILFIKPGSEVKIRSVKP